MGGFHIQPIDGNIPALFHIPNRLFRHDLGLDLAGKIVCALFRSDQPAVEQSRVHPARTHGDGADAPPFQLHIQGSCVVADERLGGAVKILIGQRKERRLRDNVDEVTAGAHMGQAYQTQSHHRTDVQVDHVQGFLHGETVVKLVRKNPDAYIDITLDIDELDLTASEAKATYKEIKEYILDKYDIKVSSLYIAQVKEKHGIIERENYNKSENEDAKVPQCPPEKAKLIEEALRHFKMI